MFGRLKPIKVKVLMVYKKNCLLLWKFISNFRIPSSQNLIHRFNKCLNWTILKQNTFASHFNICLSNVAFVDKPEEYSFSLTKSSQCLKNKSIKNEMEFYVHAALCSKVKHLNKYWKGNLRFHNQTCFLTCRMSMWTFLR